MSNLSGKLFLLIGPSGVGKGTIIDILKKQHADWVFPVSVTTREKRPNEKEGETYYFYSKERFEKEREEGAFLEWALVHEKNYYGLLKKTVFDALEAGKTVFREIDIQGFESIREIVPADNLVSIFLLPPSLEVLERRIRGRSPLADEEVERRIESAINELSLAHECDYQVLTTDGDVELSVATVEEIVAKEI